MHPLFLLVVVVAIAECSGDPCIFHGGHVNQPCKIRATSHSSSGRWAETVNDTCECPYPHRCSSDWSDSSRVITTRRVNRDFEEIQEFMLCSSQRPPRKCRQSELAVTIENPTTNPIVMEYNCYCDAEDGPLVVGDRLIGPPRSVDRFRCSSHMDVCDPTQSCFTEFNSVHYSTSRAMRMDCKCREGQFCSTDGFSRGCIDIGRYG